MITPSAPQPRPGSASRSNSLNIAFRQASRCESGGAWLAATLCLRRMTRRRTRAAVPRKLAQARHADEFARARRGFVRASGA